jgi:prepilin-type N-terminal cleavage/methylation domain-containing protein
MMNPHGPVSNRSLRSERGFTLIELLIVIVIVSLLTLAALTRLPAAAEARRMRNSARIVTSMLHNAKVRAMESGRSHGVMFEPSGGGESLSASEGEHLMVGVVHFAEVPPIYGGDTDDAHAKITGPGTATLTGVFNPDMIQAGDFIRFNYHDPWYEVASAGGGSVSFRSQFAPMPAVNASDQARVPFQVFRRPRKARFSRPSILPGNVVIDLSQSGMQQSEFASGGPLVIMFSPTGAVERIYLGERYYPPVGTIYLLIGKNFKLNGENLQDSANLWLTVGHQTGTTTVHANVAGESLKEARSRARTQQGLRGQ